MKLRIRWHAWRSARRSRPYALGTRLSRLFALQALVGLGLVCAVVYVSAGWALAERANEEIERKTDLVRLLLQRGVHDDLHDLESLRRQLDAFFGVHDDMSLSLHARDGRLVYRSPPMPGFGRQGLREAAFDVAAPWLEGGDARVVLQMDQSSDGVLLRRLGWALTAVALAGAAVVGAGGYWLVRRGLAPLRDLAHQTRALSVNRLDQRLSTAHPSEELQPWVDQVNALLGRLEQAWEQAEGFNADVAHELRTPLTILTGETELLLTGQRTPAQLRDTLASNLEELRRLSAIVGDMLFLSRADRGAEARRGLPCSLADEVSAVAEFHEAAFEERQLRIHIDGDCVCAYDRGLMRRAVSNLLGNASRYADVGSLVTVSVRPAVDVGLAAVTLAVHNVGAAIPPRQVARVFDRFFRLEAAREGSGAGHHGLGLAIVAAIVRMHGGQVEARSEGGRTTVQFSFDGRA